MEPVDVFVGLGSNVEPVRNVPRMLDRLLELAPAVDVSPIAQTAPVDIEGGKGGEFLNLVVRLRVTQTLTDLKVHFNAIEVDLGRDRQDPDRKHHDRTADLDILFTLPAGATHLPGSVTLPTEEYLRPQLDALLRYVGVVAPAAAPEPAPARTLRTVTFTLRGATLGPACATVRRTSPDNRSEPV